MSIVDSFLVRGRNPYPLTPLSAGTLLQEIIKKTCTYAVYSLSLWPGWPCTGRQWLTCFYLMETLWPRVPETSLPSSLSCHWQLPTMPAPYFKSPMAIVVHMWQTHALSLYLFSLNPVEPLCEEKCYTDLVQKQW